MSEVTLYQGDCLDVMRGMEADSVDSIVADPPYGLSFMGKDWDHGVPGIPFWEAALRVAKPGAHLLAFGGTRTFHRLACAIEDAGWEIRDTVMWVYGSGFPKSHDVSKAIDKAAGAEPEIVGVTQRAGKEKGVYGAMARPSPLSAPATPDAAKWQGWGTALKPAWEPIVVARKPLIGTVAGNVLEYGTGGINIDGCRVEHASAEDRDESEGKNQHTRYARPDSNAGSYGGGFGPRNDYHAPAGRWPANLIHDGSDEVTALFPQTTSVALNQANVKAPDRIYGGGFGNGKTRPRTFAPDAGSAARFFYCAKASKSDRDEGLEGLPDMTGLVGNKWTDQDYRRGDTAPSVARRNHHPTVKPTALMRWLVRLVTPPGGTVLDPFMGSGSTGKAAALEGFDFIGIELDADYLEIARRRIEHAQMQPALWESFGESPE